MLLVCRGWNIGHPRRLPLQIFSSVETEAKSIYILVLCYNMGKEV